MPRIEGTRLPNGRYYPLITITIELGNVNAQGLALVDSGADVTLVPPELLLPTGLDLKSLPAAGPGMGAGGDDRWMCTGKLSWRGYEICDEFLICEMGKLPFALLGRDDFLRRFVARFSWHKDPPYVDLDPVAGVSRSQGRPKVAHQ